MVLIKMKEISEAFLGQNVDNAVVTVQLTLMILKDKLLKMLVLLQG